MKLLALALMFGGCQAVVTFEVPRESGEQCADGVDNDGNDLIDCADPSCATFAACNGCGNGRLDPGEQCDDGNAIPDDGCGPDCTIDVGCGNGKVEGSEECDDGNDVDTDTCRNTCQNARCGDGVLQASEACDDGNTDDTDGCLTSCTLPTCSDGFVHAGAEDCDDGNANANDGCNACVLERCGDNITQTAPAITQLDFEWLASSCATTPGDIVVAINGTIVLQTVADDLSCNCAPAGGAHKLSTSDPAIVGLVVNGINQVTVDYAGTDQFLAWALLTIHTATTTQEIVVFEGAPGLAKARVASACTGGFAGNVPATTVQGPVAVFEECDDGNTVDADACNNQCRANL